MTDNNNNNNSNTSSKRENGILSFFQNVPSQKINKVSNLQDNESVQESIDDKSIILIEEQEEGQDSIKQGKEDNVDSKANTLTKKEQLQREKEIRKLKREQEQLLRKQKREQEKLIKEKLREQEKIKREKLREQERIKKEKLREEEKTKREELKKIKEEEKLKKENEKKAKQEAKERSQLRIGNFFKRKSSNEISKPSTATSKSDYDKNFLPFYTKDSIIISNNLILPPNKINSSRQAIDDQISHKTNDSLLDWIKSKHIKRGYNIKFKAVTLLQQMTIKEKTDQELQILLSSIPQKYIKFYENVRPPFIGTYSKDLILPVSKPFTTEGTGYNYDYDSDLEWVNEEEDGDGVDIDNLESGEEDEDDDEDEDEGSEGEFDGFLDAEDPNNTNPSKKKIIGPLIPVVHLRIQIDQLEKDDQEYFHCTSAQPILETLSLPIDPSQKIIIQRQTEQSTDASPSKQSSEGVKRNIDDVSASNNGQSIDVKKAKTLITEPKDLLKLFNEIQNSTFSLGTITEIAQKGLPQYNKLIIKHTIREYAARASPKVDSSRKWEIKDFSLWEELKNKV